MKTLVLGGSMFVGRHLVDLLLAQGHDVAVLNRGKSRSELPVEVERLVADRTDLGQMRAVLEGRQWDTVFDVSGFVTAAGGIDVEGLIDLLSGSIGRYVFVSSIMAYDQSMVGHFPWTEDLPTNRDGADTYGGFKAAAEASMLARHATSGFPVTIVRPAAIYGPDNNIFDMETAMFLRLLQGRPVLVPHGGLVVASYGHVDDLCAVMAALSVHAAAVGEVFNVSTSVVDVNTYVETLAEVVGVPADVVRVPDSMLDQITTPVFSHLFKVRHHAMLNTRKLDSVLGVARRYSLLQGHAHTYEWFCARGWQHLEAPLADPMWKVTWDFDAEAAFAERVARG
jgi:nucleoside-diphosphate-sugar epimerase